MTDSQPNTPPDPETVGRDGSPSESLVRLPVPTSIFNTFPTSTIQANTSQVSTSQVNIQQAGNRQAGIQQASDAKLIDEKANDEKVTDEKITDEKITDEKATDEKAKDQNATEEKPKSKKANDEQVSINEAGTSEKSAHQAAASQFGTYQPSTYQPPCSQSIPSYDSSFLAGTSQANINQAGTLQTGIYQPAASQAVTYQPGIFQPRVIPSPTQQRPRSSSHSLGECGHLTMAQVYNTGFRCQRCQRIGGFGWLYRCTENTEWIIDDKYRRGENVAWDAIGDLFSQQMSLGKWGPDKRREKDSVLKELSQAQLDSYTPDQIAILRAQREKVWERAEQQHLKAQEEWRQGVGAIIGDWDPRHPTDERPWVPRLGEECTYKICHRCYRRQGPEKSFLSIDSIVNGDIPPTAATAFGFSYLRERPIHDASVVSNLGYRAVPLPFRPPPPQQVEVSVFLLQPALNSVIGDYDDDLAWITTDESDGDASTVRTHSDDFEDHLPVELHPDPASIPRVDLAYLRGDDEWDPWLEEDIAWIREIERERRENETRLWIPVNFPEHFFEPAFFLTDDEVAEMAVRIPLPGPTHEEELAFTGIVVHSPLPSPIPEDEQAITEMAVQIPLPGPTYEEELFFTEDVMSATQHVEQEDGHLGSEAPEISSGVTVAEEAF